jgi:hypothetical protein
MKRLIEGVDRGQSTLFLIDTVGGELDLGKFGFVRVDRRRPAGPRIIHRFS